VGVICRVPLASGLLTGALSRDTDFAEDDHRNYNREGDAFDVGETFAGVPYEVGLDAADARSPSGSTPSPTTRPTRPATTSRSRSSRCAGSLDHDAVSAVIPGSTTPEHIRSNAAASDLVPLGEADREAVADVYDEFVREHVHQRW